MKQVYIVISNGVGIGGNAAIRKVKAIRSVLIH